MIAVGDRKKEKMKNQKSPLFAQHYGFGSKLMKRAEELAMMRGYERIAVIAGVGTRKYYKEKHGYHLEGTYMLKTLRRPKPYWKWIAIVAAACIGATYFVKKTRLSSRRHIHAKNIE